MKIQMGSVEKQDHVSKKGLSVLIRVATPSDAGSLIDINIKVIDEKLYMLRQPDEVNYTILSEIKNIENHLNCDGSLYIVAETQDIVVGYLEFQNGGFRRTKHSGMFSMFVLNEWRGWGIGYLLLKTLLKWAEENPIIEKITLAVFSTNETAQDLYRKLGFIEEGRCPKDMKLEDGSYMDSVLMYRFVF